MCIVNKGKIHNHHNLLNLNPMRKGRIFRVGVGSDDIIEIDSREIDIESAIFKNDVHVLNFEKEELTEAMKITKASPEKCDFIKNCTMKALEYFSSIDSSKQYSIMVGYPLFRNQLIS